MNYLVKLLTTEDGDSIYDPKWCLSVEIAGASSALCSQQCYGIGNSPVHYETKAIKRGGITCPECLEKIREIKAIKL